MSKNKKGNGKGNVMTIERKEDISSQQEDISSQQEVKYPPIYEPNKASSTSRVMSIEEITERLIENTIEKEEEKEEEEVKQTKGILQFVDINTYLEEGKYFFKGMEINVGLDIKLIETSTAFNVYHIPEKEYIHIFKIDRKELPGRSSYRKELANNVRKVIISSNTDSIKNTTVKTFRKRVKDLIKCLQNELLSEKSRNILWSSINRDYWALYSSGFPVDIPVQKPF